MVRWRFELVPSIQPTRTEFILMAVIIAVALFAGLTL